MWSKGGSTLAVFSSAYLKFSRKIFYRGITINYLQTNGHTFPAGAHKLHREICERRRLHRVYGPLQVNRIRIILVPFDSLTAFTNQHNASQQPTHISKLLPSSWTHHQGETTSKQSWRTPATSHIKCQTFRHFSCIFCFAFCGKLTDTDGLRIYCITVKEHLMVDFSFKHAKWTRVTS